MVGSIADIDRDRAAGLSDRADAGGEAGIGDETLELAGVQGAAGDLELAAILDVHDGAAADVEGAGPSPAHDQRGAVGVVIFHAQRAAAHVVGADGPKVLPEGDKLVPRHRARALVQRAVAGLADAQRVACGVQTCEDARARAVDGECRRAAGGVGDPHARPSGVGTQHAVAGHLHRAGIDERAPGVGVRGGQGELARAALGQSTAACDRQVNLERVRGGVSAEDELLAVVAQRERLGDLRTDGERIGAAADHAGAAAALEDRGGVARHGERKCIVSTRREVQVHAGTGQLNTRHPKNGALIDERSRQFAIAPGDEGIQRRGVGVGAEVGGADKACRIKGGEVGSIEEVGRTDHAVDRAGGETDAVGRSVGSAADDEVHRRAGACAGIAGKHQRLAAGAAISGLRQAVANETAVEVVRVAGEGTQGQAAEPERVVARRPFVFKGAAVDVDRHAGADRRIAGAEVGLVTAAADPDRQVRRVIAAEGRGAPADLHYDAAAIDVVRHRLVTRREEVEARGGSAGAIQEHIARRRERARGAARPDDEHAAPAGVAVDHGAAGVSVAVAAEVNRAGVVRDREQAGPGDCAVDDQRVAAEGPKAAATTAEGDAAVRAEHERTATGSVEDAAVVEGDLVG